MQKFLTGKMKDVSEDVINKVNAELAQVLLGIKTPYDVAKQIGELTGGGLKRGTTIVRTEVGRAFSVASHERMTQAAAVIPELKKQWRRSGKVHSRLEHDMADGQIRAVSEPFLIGNGAGGVDSVMYPRDPKAPARQTINCGCTSLPYSPDWAMLNPGKKPFTATELRSYNRQIIEDGVKL